jgi:hypothetical protein
MSLIHRAVTALVSSALAVSLVAAGEPARAAVAPSSPSGHGATWLAGQLNAEGLIHNSDFGFDDYGLTIDTAFALKAVGGHGSDVRRARNALADHVNDYTAGSTASGDPGGRYAGPTAKLLVVAQSTGGDPTSFGGVNLVRRLNGRVTRSGPAKGRIADQSAFGDFANTIGQILAVRGLTAAKSGRTGTALRFLLEQQCAQGYFRLNFSKMRSAHQSCGKNSPADPDATSYAVVQLWKTSRGDVKLRGALKDAIAWLATQQRKSGAFVGGTSTATPNTNSTGLAASALGLAGNCHAAKMAATWVAGFQVGPQPAGSKLAGERGAIAYDRAGLKAGTKDGITLEAEDQWRRAASQAAPGLLFRHGC